MNDDKKVQDPQDKLKEANKIANKNKSTSSVLDDIEESILRFFRWISSLIDKLFFTRQYIAILALILACLLYLAVNFNEESFASTLSSSKTMNNVNVSVRYNSETFEISGAPNACDITLTGDAANVNNAATKNGYCFINLEGYTEGTHNVDIVATGFGDNVNSIVNPSQATITLKRKTTSEFELSYDFINQNLLDSKYILGTPQFSTGNSKVNIRASQDTLNSIALVKALIDVSGQTSDFELQAPLVAYNNVGQMVDAEIVPSSIGVKVSVASPHKSVPIKLKITGDAPSGFALDSVTMDHQTTEIYAPESALSDVNEVSVNFDLSTITSDTEIIQPVVLPAGVSSSEVTMVNLKATLGPSESQEYNNVTINAINNNQGFGVSYTDTLNVKLKVIGTRTNLDKVSLNDFSVCVDFAEITEAGAYTLPLKVVSNTDAYVTTVVEPQSLNITLISQE